ncbi:MAG: ATP-dependent Clp protease ATP-binding subunit [Verrucomicrobia bacterium]|nr:ATP-dependent Clp protease ATP-binding subunit [Verrucomicrobiota bacterium]
MRGQAEVVERLGQAVLRREFQTTPNRGPRGAFIFAGPTGVGKTMLARNLAAALFGPNRLVRFDCSEFKTLASYQALFGDRSGDAGRLAQAFVQASAGVWVFDEIEKAHGEMVNLFLQAVDAARLTLANGQTLDLSSIYFILTTNLGSAAILGREHLPFASLEAHVSRAVERWLSPELRGRFGRPFVFRPLSREVQREIAAGHLEAVVAWNAAQGREIAIHPDVLPFLQHRGFSARLGARPVLQIIEEFVGNAIANDLVEGGPGSGLIVMEGDQLKLTR